MVYQIVHDYNRFFDCSPGQPRSISPRHQTVGHYKTCTEDSHQVRRTDGSKVVAHH